MTESVPEGGNAGRKWVLSLLGAVLGAALFESGGGGFAGLVLGGLTAHLFARVLDQASQIRALDARLRALATSLAAPTPRASIATRESGADNEAPTTTDTAVPTAGQAAVDAASANERRAGATPSPEVDTWQQVPPRPDRPSGMPPRHLPAPPNAIERAFSALVGFFTTGNLVAKVGELVLFVGVGFRVKYSIENALLPPSLRLVGAGAIGLALLAVGFRLRARTDAYGLLLQGAGIGVLYLTVFAAFRLYELIPGSAALVALVVIVVASSLLAVRQDSEAMAAWGLAGGFLAPVITSTGEGSHVALFSYYALLNLGILGMAWFRSWRWVNLLGFVFTFGISALWGASAYQPEHFVTVEAFLIWFFLHFVLVSLLFARGAARALYAGSPGAGAVNGTLVFGLPIAVFGLQSVLVEGMPFALAFTALGMAAVYVAALLVARRWQAVPALLGDSYLALTLVFASLAIPFAVADQRWTAAAWAVEGAGLVWLGLRQHSLFNRAFGLLLQLGGGIAFLHALFGGEHDGVTGFVLACAFMALSGWLMSFLYARHARVDIGAPAAVAEGAAVADDATAAVPVVHAAALISGLAMVWAWPWWIGGVLALVLEQATDAWHMPWLLVLGGASAAAIAHLGARLRWPAARRSGYAWLPAVVLLGVVAGSSQAPLGTVQDIVSWLLALAAAWSCLRSAAAGARQQRSEVDDADRPAATASLVGYWHAVTLVAATFVVAYLLHAQLDAELAWDSGWLCAVPGLVPVLVLFALPYVQQYWPVRAYRRAYLDLAPAVLLGWLGVWIVLGEWVRGLPDPLPYLPIGNPLELVQGAALLLGFGWLRDRAFRWGPALLAVVGFVLINQVTLRVLHAHAGVPWAFVEMSASAPAQTTLSLLWTMIALAAMFLGARRVQRPLWIAGAVLLGVVVTKLVLVDLSGIGTVARIVSFMGVGGLMLLIGYLAPLPPAAGERERAQAPGEAPGEAPP